jgi:maltose alpha-D-glucosyltransferase/alpha-amylase
VVDTSLTAGEAINVTQTATASETVKAAAAMATAEVEWYRKGVIYQMHVKSFCDSNGDGIGDFAGALTKLDYLEELGVTAVWLLPFYPSPLKDDGYDIADYVSVNPSYGTMDDAKAFIAEAHRRGIRVITELVINHTSDQHPWFQRARRSPKGSPERDFYVWNDTPDKYPGVRVIFKDFEPSNWTFDNVAQQYYWHRFFHHQPDLNFDSPSVIQAVFDVCDFWMALGVDGVRLDAIPYLFERDGTSCENLPETHAFLKRFRKHVDTHWPGRMLLAEANQWPEDAIKYFGDGDECQMNFHFPLMPRLFMSLRMEDRNPIIDILEQTPPLPPGAQWAMFLRNHDELTLEMVTDEERDYMWRVYASDPVARINMGIRRRLAPLLNGSRRKIELMNALLFSMPGTPVVYYGDEIGMGDNIFQGDRNGVRTPMQWSGDRNAGFSRANPQRLFLPVIIDPEYHYETVNVEAQQSNTSSLLWWMRRLIALRSHHAVFGVGDITFLAPANPKVLAFVRQGAGEAVLVVANLSRFSQPVELDLSAHVGGTPVEMFGNVRFPTVGEDGRFTLAVGPHGFYWFLIDPAEPAAAAELAVPEVRVASITSAPLADPGFAREMERRLPRLLPTLRWFTAKARHIRNVRVVARVPVPADPGVAGNARAATDTATARAVFLVEVEYDDGEPDVYAMPLSAAPAEQPPTDPAARGFLHVTDGQQSGWWVIADGTTDPTFARLLLRTAALGGTIGSEAVRLIGRTIGKPITASELVNLPVKLPKAEQSNSNVLIDERFILKLYRRLGDGVNPELEIGEHLTRVGFTNTAALAGAIEVVTRGGGPSTTPRTLAVLLTFIPNQGDAWEAFLDYAQRFFEVWRAVEPERAPGLCLPGDGGCDTDADSPPADIAELIGEPLELARLLGRRTAEMHAALANSLDGNPDFAPEPYSPTYQRALLQSMRNTTKAAFAVLSARAGTLAGDAAAMAQDLLGREADVLRSFRELTQHPVNAPRIRCHGDYHLGQVLWTGKDFVIIDFEGEPLRSIGERRLKRSGFKDVAGMVRSFDYAAWSGLRRHWDLLPPDNRPAIEDRDRRGAELWGSWLGREFVRAYTLQLGEVAPALLPAERHDTELLLRSWVLEKALYEVRYELNSRPDWAEIPLRAILAILGPHAAAATASGTTGVVAAFEGHATNQGSELPDETGTERGQA